MAVLLDTGPWVDLLSRNDTHHKWAVEQFRLLTPPLLSCEAVVAETCFVLKWSGFVSSMAFGSSNEELFACLSCCRSRLALSVPCLSGTKMFRHPLLMLH